MLAVLKDAVDSLGDSTHFQSPRTHLQATMGLAQQTVHQAKPLQSRIQSTDGNLRRLLAQLHKLNTQIYNLISERDATFSAINDAKAPLSKLQLEAHRTVQEVRPPTSTPHPHITRLLARLAASTDPTVTQAVAEFTGAGGDAQPSTAYHDVSDPNDIPMDVRSDHFYPTVDLYFVVGGFTHPGHPPPLPTPCTHVYPTADAAYPGYTATPDSWPPSQYASVLRRWR